MDEEIVEEELMIMDNIFSLLVRDFVGLVKATNKDESLPEAMEKVSADLTIFANFLLTRERLEKEGLKDKESTKDHTIEMMTKEMIGDEIKTSIEELIVRDCPSEESAIQLAKKIYPSSLTCVREFQIKK